VRIKDIAQKAGVSIATVSRVINSSGYVNEEKRRLVLQAMEELKYVPGASSRKKAIKNHRIGFVIPDITNPFFSETLKGIYKVAEREKLSIIIFDTNENINKEIDALEALKEQNISGLIITPTTERGEFYKEYLERLENMGIPVVLLDRDLKYLHYDAVYVDNIQGSYEAVEALIREGHRKIAIIAATIDARPGRDRVAGYQKALFMNGIDIDEKYMFYGEPKLESGYELTKKIVAMDDPPTAIFSYNNTMTMGCLKALRELGLRIPEDMAVIGFDDIEFINIIGLQISVVDRPTWEMGEIAMEMLVDRIREKKSGSHTKAPVKEVILPTKLILRGSEKYFPKDSGKGRRTSKT